MKVLVENCETLLYLASGDRWVEKFDEAMTFPTGASAIQYCLRNQIPKAQVVLKFPEADLDVKLPVSDECLKTA